MPDESDFFRAYARDVGLNPTVNGFDNVQDALAGAGLGLSSATAHLTGAELSTLFSAPTEIIPAPDAGLGIVIAFATVQFVPGPHNTFYDATDGTAALYYGSPDATRQASLLYVTDALNGLDPSAQIAFGSGVQMINPNQPNPDAAGFVGTADVDGAAIVFGALTPDPDVAGGIDTATLDDGGTGYVVGDTGTVDRQFGSVGGGAYEVTAVAPITGAVTAFTITAPGEGYAPMNNPAATTAGGSQPGIGTGLTVDVTLLAADGDLYVTAFYVTVPIV